MGPSWAPVKVECPVCHTKNKFQEWVSFGSYVYQWPSKYQFIFWPFTESPVLYSCRKCHLTAFMQDFAKIPADKIPELQRVPGPLKLPEANEYTKIPMSSRQVVAEKVYGVLVRGDDFWSLFYRVMGYHYQEENDQAGADKARQKVLEVNSRMASSDTNTGIRKELLLHFRCDALFSAR